MSRSYKKHPFCCVVNKEKTSAVYKRIANRRARQIRHLANGNFYRRVFCSWDICEGMTRMTKQEWIRMFLYQYANEKECLKDWYKYYRNK